MNTGGAGNEKPTENHVEASPRFSQDAPLPMIHSILIQNFRCFKNLNLQDLGRVNIVVGQNGSGKTAFLEALYLPGGNQGLAFLIRALRGLTQGMPAPPQFVFSKTVYESFWEDLFLGFARNSKIVIDLHGDPQNERTLTIFYEPQDQTQMLIGFQENSLTIKGAAESAIRNASGTIDPLKFETTAGNKTYSVRATVQPTPQGLAGISISGDNPPNATITFISSTSGLYNLQQEFSRIDTEYQKPKLVAALQEVFPIIKDLSLGATPIGTTDLFCEVDGLPKKVPVGLVSAGIHRYLVILISMFAVKNGVMLVDEVENGIFYGNLDKAWRGIFKLCKEFNVQLFASTHSKECLDALRSILEEEPDQFRLIRTKAENDGTHSAEVFRGDEFESALKVGIDPRGN